MSNMSNVIQIPQHEIDLLARCLLPDLMAFYESEEGQKEFAEANDMIIVDTYIDRALSAKTNNRPEFQKMIKIVQREHLN